MNQNVKEYLARYPQEIVALFFQLRDLVYENTSLPVDETLWAKLPTYSAGGAFLRLIPFQDHINIEAKAVLNYRERLGGYRLTPKGMLQLFVHQQVPREVLVAVFRETLGG